MDNIDLNSILERNIISKEIETFLNNYNHRNNICKRGLYIYGDNGIGKTKFILNLLKKLDYDVIYYDSSIIRNKALIDNICNNNLSTINVHILFYEKQKKIVFLIDDIDTMNHGDKNGIISLIKLIRVKKTKKQKLENITNNPIICINNKVNDKKILELMKVCNVFELKSPNNNQLLSIINNILPDLFVYNSNENSIIKKNILNFLNNNLIGINKLIFYKKNNIIYDKFYKESSNLFYDSNSIKLIIKNLLNKFNGFDKINSILESDRTIVSLLFHENIIQLLNNTHINDYLNILNNYIFCDYIDRLIFQKQIWQLTEINYIIKLFYSNYLLKENNLYANINQDDIIFTKILTKYSSEYNNYMFIYNFLQSFLIDKKDIFILFYTDDIELNIQEFLTKFNTYNISKLELMRICKFIYQIIKNTNNYNISNDIISHNINYNTNDNLNND